MDSPVPPCDDPRFDIAKALEKKESTYNDPCSVAPAGPNGGIRASVPVTKPLLNLNVRSTSNQNRFSPLAEDDPGSEVVDSPGTEESSYLKPTLNLFKQDSGGGQWRCTNCTADNLDTDPECSACGSEMRGPPSVLDMQLRTTRDQTMG